MNSFFFFINWFLLKRAYVDYIYLQTVKGGTGWAVELGKLFNKKIYVFDQELNQWFTWDYKNQFFTISEVPLLTYTYAGIGTRELKENGKINIGLVYRKTLKHLWENYEKER